MTGWRRLLAAASLLVLAAAPARADYAVGLAAYHGGDFAAARAEFEKVADSDPRALVALGIMVARGDGIDKDMAKAADYFGRAAAAGDAAGQYQLGRLNYSGAGVAADKAEAARLFGLAAAQGHVAAIQALSLMLETGDGVAADPKRALELARRNADAGVPRDQVRLAKMYAEGRGTAADPVEAYYWMALAARTGQPDAKGLRDDYAAKLSPDQRAAQDQRIADWTPQLNPKN